MSDILDFIGFESQLDLLDLVCMSNLFFSGDSGVKNMHVSVDLRSPGGVNQLKFSTKCD